MVVPKRALRPWLATKAPQLCVLADLVADRDVVHEQADEPLHVLRVDEPGVTRSEVPDCVLGLKALEGSRQRPDVVCHLTAQSFGSLGRVSTMSTDPPR